MVFKKSQHAWRLAKSSIIAIKTHKNLWILVFLARGIYFLIASLIAYLVWLMKTGVIDYNKLSTKEMLIGYLLILLALFIGNIISGYFNAALLDGLFQYESENELETELGIGIDLRKAFRKANQKFLKVFLWIFFQLTVGIFLFFFYKSMTKIRGINDLISGLRWHNAILLVFPCIILEKYKVLTAIRCSSQLIKDYAGPDPQIKFNFTFIFLLARLISMVPSIIGYILNKPVWINLGIVITFILFLLITILHNVISLSIQKALYSFLAYGKVSRGFKIEDLTHSLQPSIETSSK